MGGAEQRLTEATGTEADRELGHLARWHALAVLVPPLVHKLGNCLGAVVGLTDLVERRASRGDGAGPLLADGLLKSAREQAEVATGLTRLLSRQARASRAGPSAEDVGDAARAAGALVEPLLHTLGASYRPARAQGAVAHVDGNLAFQWFATAAVEVLGVSALEGATPASSGPRPAVLRLEVRPRRGPSGSAELRLVAIAAFREPHGLGPPQSAGLGERPGRASARARVRRLWVDLPAKQAERGPEAGGRGRQLWLLERDDMLAELIALVLSESGYRIERLADLGELAGRLAGGPAPALTLVGGGQTLDGQVLESCRRAGVPLAVLGEGHPKAPLPTLAKPFRPAELLAFVQSHGAP